jgi:uncharacterized membrane protein
VSGIVQATVTTLFVLGSSIWIGGYVAIAVVARVARRTLEPARRVAFFRALGRAYLLVGTPSLLLALGTGAGLLGDHRWDGTVAAAATVAVALLAALGVGVAQARRMSRLRAAAVAAPADRQLRDAVRDGARSAGLLRAAIGLLTVALVVLGSVLAS